MPSSCSASQWGCHLKDISFSFSHSPPPSLLFMPLCSPRQAVYQSPGGPVPEHVYARQPSQPTGPDIRWIFFIQRRTRVIGHGQSVWEDIIQSMFVMKCTLWGATPCVPCRTRRPGGREVKCLAVPAWLGAFFKGQGSDLYNRPTINSEIAFISSNIIKPYFEEYTIWSLNKVSAQLIFLSASNERYEQCDRNYQHCSLQQRRTPNLHGFNH